jgi:menaquinone-dependent protoporphyrinogen oxidase
MRVLVSWGSQRGGTEGIAQTIGEELKREGSDVVLSPASAVNDLRGYDAVIVGGSVYANRWHRDAYRLVARNVAALRRIPVWLFSSGPLDESADRGDIAPPPQVSVLMERIGAQGHATFGGRLLADAKGFPAAAMAKKVSGDWRNPDHVRAWTADVARAIPNARPRTPVEPPGRSLWRLLAHGVAGWAICAALMAVLMQTAGPTLAIAIHAAAAPLVFIGIAIHYFRARGARDPLPTALAFVAIVVVLDAGIVAGLVLRSFAMFESLVGTWLPFALIFLATWITGFAMSMMPAPKAGLTGKEARESHSSVSPG